MNSYTVYLERCPACGRAHDLALSRLSEPKVVQGHTVYAAGFCPAGGLMLYADRLWQQPDILETGKVAPELDPDAAAKPTPTIHYYCPNCDEHKDCRIRITDIYGSGPGYVTRGIDVHAEAVCPDCGNVAGSFDGFLED